MGTENTDESFFDELFRENYGKITGALIRKFGPEQFDLIESAIQDAFLKAIQLWPNKGRPEKPLNWLIRVASNSALDHLRHQTRLGAISNDVFNESAEDPTSHFSDEVTDDDLRMLFLCCHPVLPLESQLAFLLKAAYGFNVKEIAKAFVSTEEAIAQSRTLAVIPAFHPVVAEAGEFGLPAHPLAQSGRAGWGTRRIRLYVSSFTRVSALRRVVSRRREGWGVRRQRRIRRTWVLGKWDMSVVLIRHDVLLRMNFLWLHGCNSDCDSEGPGVPDAGFVSGPG